MTKLDALLSVSMFEAHAFLLSTINLRRETNHRASLAF